MNKIVFILLFAILLPFCIHAQQADPVVLKIDDKPILRSQVEAARKKSIDRTGEKEPIADFIESYINFKLNLEEAKAQRLDTTAAYIRDLSVARVQMSSKYMQDTIYENKYARMIYDRMLENVEINHTLLPFSQKVVFPADTVVLYKQALELRKKLLKDGFPAKQSNVSNTSMITDFEAGSGYLGWVSPFMLSYHVENMAYSLPVNEISMPVRSDKGYHIIQVLNKRPAIGAVELEQVLFNFSILPATQHQIDSVGQMADREYKRIKSAVDFQSLCDEFSRVQQTGDKGCYFGLVNVESNLPPSFVAAAFNLEKEGDVSKPVLTDYGYHILRLLKRIPLPEFALLKSKLTEQITRSDRNRDILNVKFNSMAKDLSLIISQNAYKEINMAANNTSPQDAAFLSLIKNGEDELFSLENKEIFRVKDFMEYIRFRQNILKDANKPKDEPEIMQVVDMVKHTLSTDILKEYFDAFLFSEMSDYYYSTLENRFPEFDSQMEKFSDELLLFAVLDNNVWERSKKDEAGLAEYFNKNKKKYKFNEKKYKGIVVYTKNEEVLQKVKDLSKGINNTDTYIQKIRNVLAKDMGAMLVERGTWAKGDNAFVDKEAFGGNTPTERKGYPFHFVTGEFIDAPKDFTDVRNEVEADYLNVLENNWKNYLKTKYKVEIDKAVLKSIK